MKRPKFTKEEDEEEENETPDMPTALQRRYYLTFFDGEEWTPMGEKGISLNAALEQAKAIPEISADEGQQAYPITTWAIAMDPRGDADPADFRVVCLFDPYGALDAIFEEAEQDAAAEPKEGM